MRPEVKVGIIAALIVTVGCVYYFVSQSQEGGDLANTLPMDAPADRALPDAGKPVDEKDEDDSARPTAVDRKRPAQRDLPSSVERRMAARRDAERKTAPPTGILPPLGSDRPKPTTPRRSDVEAERSRVTPRQRTSPTTQPATRGPRGAGAVTRNPISASGDGRAGEGMTSPTTQPTAQPTATNQPVKPRASERTIERPRTVPRPRVTAPRTRSPGTPQQRKHRITEEDSLWNLAVEYYEDGTLWPRIKAANPGLNERALPVGQYIIIPPKEGNPTRTTPATRDGGRDSDAERDTRRAVYIVESGDTFIKIARNVLDDPTRWRELYELNKDRLPDPDDPDRLIVGLELKLPPKKAD